MTKIAQSYLVLMGASGTGKTYIRDALVSMAPGEFVNVIQHTTRPIRPNEKKSTYVFEDSKSIEKVYNDLIGRCHINGNIYGSEKLNPYESRTGIIILNKEGFDDFIRCMNKPENSEIFFKTVGIWRPFEESVQLRKNERDPEYIRKEYEIYSEADMVYNNDYEKVSIETVLDIFKKLKMSMSMNKEASKYESEFRKYCIGFKPVPSRDMR